MKKNFLTVAVISVCASCLCGSGYAEDAPDAEYLSLDESVTLALNKNENIEASEASRDSSRHQLSAARRASGLNVGWNATANKIGGGYYRNSREYYNFGLSNDPYRNEFSNTLSAQFPIYSGGLIEGRIKSAGFQSASADLTLERTRQQVRFQTMQAYYTLLQRQNLLSVAQNAANNAESQLKLIQIQYEEGAVPKADVLQMQVQLASYTQDLVTARGSCDVAMYQLARLVGREGKKIILKDKLTYEPFPYTLNQAEEFAMLRRPDKIAASFDVKQAEAQVDVAAAGYKPKVNASYTRNISDNRPFLRDGRTETWSAGLNMSMNVFDNAITTANVDAAKSNVDRAKANETNIKKTLLLETRSAYAQMKSAETNISASEIAVEQARESYEIASVRYDEGVDNLLAVTTAQERLTRAQTNYYNALYNYNLYRAQLEYAVGYPVAIDAAEYENAMKNAPGSANRLNKIEENSKIK